jgi:hypothetical protein
MDDARELERIIRGNLEGKQRRRALKLLKRLERSVGAAYSCAVSEAAQAAKHWGGSSAEDAVLDLQDDCDGDHGDPRDGWG